MEHSVRSLIRTVRLKVAHHSLPALVGLALLLLLVGVTFALHPTPAGRPVLIAVTDLPAGKPVEPQSTAVVLVPEAATTADALSEPRQVADLTPKTVIPSGSILTRALLQPAGELIPKHFAAVQVELPTGVNLEPGTHTQIWGPGESCSLEPTSIELLALQATVQSLSVSDGTLLQGEDTTVASLLVPESSVADVLCAAQVGQLHFVRGGD